MNASDKTSAIDSGHCFIEPSLFASCALTFSDFRLQVNQHFYRAFKSREGAGGRLAGGQHFSRGALFLMLQNRTYRGEITHQGTACPGQHKAILDPELWQSVQDKLTANRREHSLAVGAEAPSLLAGL
ncbi:MAG TPA: recombinase family protein, partial [Gemmataceae bacterium]|nr:recombinase family protein [Gemmataceae bacterium]